MSETSFEGYPSYLPLLTILTGVYLTFELGFNARLLDVAGSMPDDKAIDNMDHIGRIISGIAVTLAVWGLVIFPVGEERRWPFSFQVIPCLITAIICIFIVFYGEKHYIDQQAQQKTGAERRTAMQLALVTRAIHLQDVSIDGIDLSPRVLSTPEGKSFSALFPALSQSIPSIAEKLHPALPALIENQILSEDQMQSADAFKRLAYDTSVLNVEQKYAAYIDVLNAGIRKANRAIDRANARIAKWKSPDEIRSQIPARQANSTRIGTCIGLPPQ